MCHPAREEFKNVGACWCKGAVAWDNLHEVSVAKSKPFLNTLLRESSLHSTRSTLSDWRIRLQLASMDLKRKPKGALRSGGYWDLGDPEIWGTLRWNVNKDQERNSSRSCPPPQTFSPWKKRKDITQKIHWTENAFPMCGLQQLLILERKKKEEEEDVLVVLKPRLS